MAAPRSIDAVAQGGHLASAKNHGSTRMNAMLRADHIGSLMRPKTLRDAYKELAARRCTQQAFDAVLDDSIRDAIRMQQEAGMDVVTDGEFRRRSWFAGFVDAVDGLVHRDTQFRFVEGGAAQISVPVPHTEAPIRRSKGIATGEFSFARGAAAKPVKITLPSPSVIHFHRGPEAIDRSVYPDEAQWWEDLIAVYREEIAELGRLGCSYLQLDEVPMALLCDPNIQRRIAAWDWDWRELLERYARANDALLAGRPAGMIAGIHLCRGNYRGHFIGSGGYEPVAEKLFSQDADVFLLEYDSERAGDFSPLRFVHEGKGVVLGLVSSKTPQLEDENELRRRIDQAAAYVPLERLALSPQCGFGTTVGGAPMSEDDQRRKLELVGRVARQVWT
ncbi:MAG: 5-methyltetrahydropteroyltriglutamate--homocysteine S-methyltransferase [Betaproteobacteria bacterium]|nr:5-methyltetrahydropteroyltriglutamate--homocysteine S-methyltransferase [Betaproteobacteria bacterium]